jgi:hypothetical protein
MVNSDTVEYMMIGNKKIPVRTEEIDIFQLDYYPENPRINYVLSKYGDQLDQNTIEESLWTLDSTKSLAQDIRRNGGLIEEILVLDGQVVEGNTRLCAYRHLYKGAPEGQKEKWKKIRAKKLLEKIDIKDLFLLLGKLHIEGKTPWDPYEKASYIYKMNEENGMSLEEISHIVGMNVSSIKTQIAAYEFMRDGYLPKITKLDDKETEIKKFSIFLEYFRSSDLQKIKRESPEVLTDEKFIRWVLEGRVRSAAYDVRKDLANILRCKPARKVFLQESPEEAIPAANEVVALDRPETADSFFAKLDQMTKFLSEAPVIKIKSKVAENPRMRGLIDRFQSEVKKFYRNIVTDYKNNPESASIISLNKKNTKHLS